MVEGREISVKFDDDSFEALREFVANDPTWVAILASARRQRHVWTLRADYVSLQFLAQDITHQLVRGEDLDDAELLDGVASTIETALGLG